MRTFERGTENSTDVRVALNDQRTANDERVSLAPLDPVDALRALLATPPIKESKR